MNISLTRLLGVSEAEEVEIKGKGGGAVISYRFAVLCLRVCVFLQAAFIFSFSVSFRSPPKKGALN